MEIQSKDIRTQLIAILVITAIMSCSFVLYLKANENRIVETNTWYAGSTTMQSASLMDEMMQTGKSSIQMVAALLQGKDLSNDTEGLETIAKDTLFDSVFYVTRDGTAHTMSGKTRDVRTQPYYQKGIAGDTGIEPILQLSKEEIKIMAYSPVKDDTGEISGIIVGSFANERLGEVLSEKFFDAKVNSYLCTEDGEIIARSDGATTVSNVLDLYVQNPDQTQSAEELKEAFQNHTNTSYTFEGNYGIGIAYVAAIEGYDMTLVCTFPSAVTAGIINKANQAGGLLSIICGACFLAYMSIIIVQGRRRQKYLKSENFALYNSVKAVAKVFDRFIQIDFKNDTYTYTQENEGEIEIAKEGTIETFKTFWAEKLADEDKSNVIGLLSPEGMKEEMDKSHLPYIQRTYRINTIQGVRWIQLSLIPVDNNDPKYINNALLAIQDVTEAVEKEERQKQALEEAIVAAKQASEAKTDFLNSMSHDIRTPMNSIMGLTAIAEMHIGDDAKVKDCLEKINISSQHLLRLINEVLDMAKIESGTIELAEENIDLSEAVENLITIVNPQAKAKNLELSVDIANVKHEHVIGDATRLQQVLVNVMNNSVKFTDEGSIRLTIKELPSTLEGYGHYEFCFQDTGVGMSPEFLEKVFEPFARAHDTRTSKTEGTGLGMAIVKNIVSLMNGSITVQSELGVGTTFTIDVYLKIRSESDEDTSGLHGYRILVADDDETACESATEMLRSIGMEAEWVTSADEAVAAVQAAHAKNDPFAACILDWRMPGKSGIEAAREIRKTMGHDIPIIILSAYDWTAIEAEAKETGVDAFIAKPLFRSRLVRVLKELLLSEREENKDRLQSLRSADFEGKRVLLVEDNLMAAAIGQEILETTHVEVEHAENGKIAVETLESHEPGYFDLVLMDVQMPIMGGYEATRAIRELGENGRPDLATIPIIALTADAFADDLRKAEMAGMNAHLSKPMDITELVETMKEWMD